MGFFLGFSKKFKKKGCQRRMMNLSAIVERSKKVETASKVESYFLKELKSLVITPSTTPRKRKVKVVTKPRQLLVILVAARILKSFYTADVASEGLHSKSPTATLRGLYYDLVHTSAIKSANDITKAVTTITNTLKVNRHDIMVIASGRARLAARLRDGLGNGCDRTIEVVVRDCNKVLLQLDRRGTVQAHNVRAFV